MNGLVKISWRNVWRNKRRSLVILMAVALGLWGGIFATGLATGMVTQRFRIAIERQISHIQIHHPKFIDYDEVKYHIPEATELVSHLNSDDMVLSVSARTMASVMVASSAITAGVQIIGVDAEQERATTRFDEFVVEGTYFTEEGRNPVIVGKRLADKMKIEPGSRLVLTFPDMQGEIVRASFRVAGIYQTTHTQLDELRLYVRRADLQALVGNCEPVNEIAILLNDVEHLSDVIAQLKNRYPELSIRSYAEISPEVSYMQEMAGITYLVIIIIILLALAFGLLNTMLMTVYERTRELGMLMAVGMNKKRVFLMVMLETTFLTFTGAIVGILLGGGTVWLTARNGVDLSGVGGDTLTDFGYDAVVIPELHTSFFLNLVILVLCTSFLASVYPAFKALKMRPAEAIRKD